MSKVKQELMEIDNFEDFISRLYGKLGWSTTVTQKSRDHGIDVIATKGDKKHLIQVKQWEQNVPAPKVREYLGLLSQEENVDYVEIITTSDFTKNGYEIAEDVDIKLISGDDLEALMAQTDIKPFSRQQREESMAEEPETLQDATRIVKDYVDNFVKGEWDGIADGGDTGYGWSIEFYLSREGERDVYEITVANDGEIYELDDSL